MRIEHVKHSKCRDDFLKRVKENEEKRKAAKAKGEYVQLKRQVMAVVCSCVCQLPYLSIYLSMCMYVCMYVYMYVSVRLM